VSEKVRECLSKYQSVCNEEYRHSATELCDVSSNNRRQWLCTPCCPVIVSERESITRSGLRTNGPF